MHALHLHISGVVSFVTVGGLEDRLPFRTINTAKVEADWTETATGFLPDAGSGEGDQKSKKFSLCQVKPTVVIVLQGNLN